MHDKEQKIHLLLETLDPKQAAEICQMALLHCSVTTGNTAYQRGYRKLAFALGRAAKLLDLEVEVLGTAEDQGGEA